MSTSRTCLWLQMSEAVCDCSNSRLLRLTLKVLPEIDDPMCEVHHLQYGHTSLSLVDTLNEATPFIGFSVDKVLMYHLCVLLRKGGVLGVCTKPFLRKLFLSLERILFCSQSFLNREPRCYINS